ncbi:MAG: HIT family protein [Kofleriaceae bacterium]
MSAACALCARLAAEPPLWSDDRWDVRPIDGPPGVAGWTLLSTRAHVPSLAELDDASAAELGVIVRRVHRAVRTATGAPKVYIAALAEAVPHVHVHLVPRAADAPAGFALFDTQRAARAGELAVDPAEAARVAAAIAAALR